MSSLHLLASWLLVLASILRRPRLLLPWLVTQVDSEDGDNTASQATVQLVPICCTTATFLAWPLASAVAAPGLTIGAMMNSVTASACYNHWKGPY